MWVSVQGLRAIAAYMIIVHHLILTWNGYVGTKFESIPIIIGTAGVDIFFVISGFVMVEATRGKALSPIKFLEKRLNRIVPLYWLLSILTAAAMAAGLHLFGDVRADLLPDLVHSLLFLPIFTPESGLRSPLLFVGWSLNYEMFFYAVFALALLLSKSAHRVAAIAAVFLALSLAAQASGHPLLLYYASPLIWEFVLGMIIAVNVDALRLIGRRHGAALGWLALGAGALALGSAVVLAEAHIYKVLVHALGSASIVLGAVYLEITGRCSLLKFLQHQGDASYSIYLTHPFVLQCGGKILIILGLNATAGGTLLGLAAIGLAAIPIGTAVHLFVEKPMLRRGRAALQGRGDGPLALPNRGA